MISLRVRGQLAVFAVISVLVLTVTVVNYLQLPRLFGLGQYTVSADFADASGLYANALVTYRGVDVGRVHGLDLSSHGVLVQMRINDGTRIPADVRAEIHSTSAVGEQYVDLVPTTPGAPYLAAGSIVPRRRTVELPQASDLLDSVDALLRTLPKPALSQALASLSTALAGAGPDLQRLLDSSSSLLHDAIANVGPTRDLLDRLSPVLSTQQQLAAQTTSYVSDLASFTDQLARSNGDIDTLLRTGPAFADQLTGAVKDLSPSIPLLLANLTSVGQVVQVYLPAVEQTLVVYPALTAALQAALLPNQADQEGNLYFKLNINDPPPCINGFLPVGQRRDPGQLSVINTPAGLYCKASPSDPRSVRGTRNLPCLNNPGVRAPSPEACAGRVQGTSGQPTRRVSAVPYEPATGRFLAPDGTFYLLGNVSPQSGKGPGTWQQLLLRPISG